ncbi:unnamed protein product [Caenorhabditis sp. 36 PRJEB53466]|nr:unnamed protein product [Caenorhabditis sp. 36 PRJEB53466]
MEESEKFAMTVWRSSESAVPEPSFPWPPLRRLVHSVFGVAPHLVTFMASGVMAVNRHCFVECQVVGDRMPGAQDSIEIPDHSDGGKPFQIIRELLTELHVQKMYEFKVSKANNLSGQFALISVAVAMWKAIQSFERDVANESALKTILDELLTKHNVDIPCKTASINAALSGSVCFIHLNTGPEDPADRSLVDAQEFYDKYDLLFIRTSLHRSEFQPSRSESREIRDALHLSFFYESFDEESDVRPDSDFTPAVITAHSKARMSRPDNRKNLTAAEIASDSGLRSVWGELEQEIEGFEVQQGGNLVILKKKTVEELLEREDFDDAPSTSGKVTIKEEDEQLYKAIANSIHAQIEDAAHVSITFTPLRPSGGVRSYPTSKVPPMSTVESVTIRYAPKN